jgi:hypothetical protein
MVRKLFGAQVLERARTSGTQDHPAIVANEAQI